MAINIPTLPAGILDANNLYNDVYTGIVGGPLAWSNISFHLRLGWINLIAPYVIEHWYTPTNGFGGHTLNLSTMLRVSIGNSGLDIDVLNIIKNPELIAYALLKERDGAAPLTLIPYPGDAAAANLLDSTIGTQNPIGSEIIPSPWGPGRPLFRDNNSDDRYKPGDLYDAVQIVYRKVLILVAPGKGPGGSGNGQYSSAWEINNRR